jgi:lysozyme family protein
MARFNDCLAFTLGIEGGYSNNAADHGGSTNFGVTQAVYDTYRHRIGLPLQPVKFITLDDASEIYLDDYWTPAHCAIIPQPLDLCVFDTSVNYGVTRSIMLLQQSVGVDDDGDYGRESQAAVAAAAPLILAAKFCDAREAFYKGIVARNPSQAVFLDGWINRINSLRKACGVATVGSAA